MGKVIAVVVILAVCLALYGLGICLTGWLVWSAASLFVHLPAGSLGSYALVGAAISVVGGAFRATVTQKGA